MVMSFQSDFNTMGQGINSGDLGSAGKAAWNQLNPVNSVMNPINDITGMTAPVQNQYDPFGHTYDPMAQNDPVKQMLMARAMGQGGTSAAELQARGGYDAARQAAQSAAAGSTNPAQARRVAMQAAAGLTAQQANQGATLRAQEQQQAQQGYTGLMQAQQQMIADQQRSANQAAGQISGDNADRQQKANGGLLSAAGGALASIFSDQRRKHDIDEARGSKGVSEMLKALRAARYEYNDPADGDGPQYGVMAQDVASTEAGRSFVRATPGGLKLDGTRAIGPILAALAHLDAKIDGGK